MFWVKIKRITKSGFVNFWRNGWVSLATVLIMVVTLFVIGSLIFAKTLLSSTLAQIQDKVDISIYFKTDANENDIMALKNSVSKLNEVKEAIYISKDDAIKNFQERHKDNALIVQSLTELGDNPLGAVINIKAKDPSQYEAIAKFLQAEADIEDPGSVIDKINYFQNKNVIDKLTKVINSSKNLGVSLSIVLIIISILVSFNTIRLAIYTARDEISVMRLVGASSKNVTGPFIVEGIMYGVISSVVAVAVFYPFTYWLGPETESFFGGMNIFNYYLSNFISLFFILLSIGVFLGALSSFIAVRRYLKV
ncbi:MAG: permease-like cell division protein FtsX [Patescibacteria group bacterium]